MTPGDDDDLPSIGNKCLELCKLLGNQGLAFSFNLSFGTFCFSLDTTGMRSSPAQVPVKKKKSPSAINRDKRRRIAFLRRKDAASSSGASLTVLDTLASSGTGNPSPVDTLGATAAFESPQPSAHKEPTQPFSESLFFPSASESAHLDPEAQSSPKYRIQQTDGNCSLSDISLCDQPSEHGDDSNMDQCSLCPNCDQTFTSTHQCCETDETQLKSKYDKFMHGCERAIAVGLRSGAYNEAKIEEALVEFRLEWDFETWQRKHIRP